MDLTDETGYQFLHEKNPITDIVTITIKNKEGSVVLDTIEIEYYKVRPLLDSLAELGKNLYPDTVGSNNWRRRTILDKNEGTAITEFSVP